MNPLTFQIELSMTDLRKLPAENISRTQEFLDENKDVLLISFVSKTQPIAARILEWILDIMLLYKFNFMRKTKVSAYSTEHSALPKLRKTMVGFAGNEKLLLTGTKKHFEEGRANKTEVCRRLKSENIPRKEILKSQNEEILRKRREAKKTGSGRYVTGKTFALSKEFQMRREEIPLAILQGKGDQRAIIMKTANQYKSGREYARADNSGLGFSIDKLS